MNDPAIQNKLEMMPQELFPIIEKAIDSVAPEQGFLDQDILAERFRALKDIYEDDRARTLDFADILFEEDVQDYGKKIADVFAEWEKAGEGPNLLSMAVVVMERFGIDLGSPEAQSLALCAVLAEYPNNLQYHGNEHYRKVFLHMVRLLSKHNQLFESTNRVLSKMSLAQSLIAACIHDLGHEGGDNMRNGVYTPGFMEQKAFDVARPYLETCGMSADDIGEIETIVFCTDITFFAGDNSPCIRMKKIYKYYFWDDEVNDVSIMMMGKLRRYEDNPRLAQMAMLLHEADVGSSAGVCYEQTKTETINIMEERGLKSAGPKVVLAFLREQLGETMYTEAAKQVFGPAMDEVIRHAEEDYENGIETFYE